MHASPSSYSIAATVVVIWVTFVLDCLCIQEGINGEFQEKKADLQPKVVEIYESAPAPLKVIIYILLLCFSVPLQHKYIRRFVLQYVSDQWSSCRHQHDKGGTETFLYVCGRS